MKYLLVFFTALALLFSCSIQKQDFSGTYHLAKSYKTKLLIKDDKTFWFERISPNPYLHPFDHPEEYYATTSGIWKKIDKNKIELNSQKHSMKICKNVIRLNFIFTDTDLLPLSVVKKEINNFILH